MALAAAAVVESELDLHEIYTLRGNFPLVLCR